MKKREKKMNRKNNVQQKCCHKANYLFQQQKKKYIKKIYKKDKTKSERYNMFYLNIVAICLNGV